MALLDGWGGGVGCGGGVAVVLQGDHLPRPTARVRPYMLDGPGSGGAGKCRAEPLRSAWVAVWRCSRGVKGRLHVFSGGVEWWEEASPGRGRPDKSGVGCDKSAPTGGRCLLEVECRGPWGVLPVELCYGTLRGSYVKHRRRREPCDYWS